MTLRMDAVNVDCLDPERVARFWAALLDRPLGGPDEDGDWWVEGGADAIEIFFARVTEVRRGKNRLHLDLRPGDQEAEVRRALELGAIHVDVGQGEVSWVVLADPEGNEFCILRASDTWST